MMSKTLDLAIHMYNMALQYRMVAREGFDLRANSSSQGCCHLGGTASLVRRS